MDVVEQEAAKISDTVCLAVGVHSGYGPAQRMYVKEDTISTEVESGIREKFTRKNMSDRVVQIRESEKKSHSEIYLKEKLYDTDGWLSKPIKTVREICTLFSDCQNIRVLDLGAGVGRNSIYLAEEFKSKECLIDCVDFLDIAIDKLNQNAMEHDVSRHINGIVESIEEYAIAPDTYDLIMAVSALEHVDSEAAFVKKLEEIKHGIKNAGIACLVMNSEIREVNADTYEELEPQFEVNMTTEKMNSLIENTFKDWKVIKKSVVKQEYEIPRNGVTSKLSTNVITFVVRKWKE